MIPFTNTIGNPHSVLYLTAQHIIMRHIRLLGSSHSEIERPQQRPLLFDHRFGRGFKYIDTFCMVEIYQPPNRMNGRLKEPEHFEP